MGESTYWVRKAMGKCVSCDEKAEEGYVHCLACRMDIRAKGCTHSEESKHRQAQRQKRKKDLLYAFGVCNACWKRDATEGLSVCSWCRSKSRLLSEKRRRANPNMLPRPLMDGGDRCARCGKLKSSNGHKVCNDCYPTLRESMSYARSLKKERNYFEKLNDAF